MCEFDSANKANVHRKKANQKEIKFPKIPKQGTLNF